MLIRPNRKIDGSYELEGKSIVCRSWAMQMNWQKSKVVIRVVLEPQPGYHHIIRCEGEDDDNDCPAELDGQIVDSTFSALWTFAKRDLDGATEFWFKQVNEVPRVEVGQVWNKVTARYKVKDILCLRTEDGEATMVVMENANGVLTYHELGYFTRTWTLHDA